jgi:hypothetical protein
MQLTREQRIFIVLEFKETKSCEKVRRAFIEKFPLRSSPNKKTVYKTVSKFDEHGSILNRNKGNSGRKITKRTEANVAFVRQLITENPHCSVRRNGSGLTKTTFHKILQKDIGMHPYKMQRKHQLLPHDYVRRRAFCNWIAAQQPRFIERLVVTDEAAFSMNGSVNTQNTRFWSNNPPEDNVFENSLRREKLSVWAGLCGNGTVIGPFFYDANLNGEHYLQMLNESILPSLELAYTRNQSRQVWFQQDGAPAHRRNIVKDKLREVFGQRVLALGFDVEWPPRSPDLTPCDFFLWGYVKSLVFETQPPTLEILRERVEDAFERLKNDRTMIRRAVGAMMKRANTCLERNGGHVEGY